MSQSAPERRDTGLSGADNNHDPVSGELAGRLDGPIEELLAVRLQLAALIKAENGLRAELEPLLARIDATIRELRQIVLQGKNEVGKRNPPRSARPDLYAELGEICTGFRAETGIACTFEILPEDTRFGHFLSDVLRRSIRELLVDMREHVQASRVRLRSGRTADGHVFLSVEGKGGNIEPIDRTGSGKAAQEFGIWRIDHRLRQFEGFTEIDGSSGVMVRVLVPVSRLEG